MIRRALVCVAAIACLLGPTPASRGQSLIRSAFGGGHAPLRSAPVPPVQEIELLDPNADPAGNPAVEIADLQNGRSLVDIPRLVVVHKYYYSGDRSFQYKLIPGGPCVIVVNHPRTGERLYLEATLPPGAPRVYYDAGSIEYDYGQQGVKIVFGSGKHGAPKIVYRQGTRWSGLLDNLTESRSTRMKQVGERLRDEANAVNRIDGGPEPEPRFGDRTRRIIAGASKGVHDAGRALRERASRAVRSTPAGALTQDASEERAAEAQAVRERLTEPAALDAQPTVESDF